MKCSECGKGIEPGKFFDMGGARLCRDCFFERAQKPRELKKEDLARLKREVEGETAGLLPHQTLLQLIEDGYDRVVGGGAFDEEVERLAIEMQRLAGLAVTRKTMEILDALGKLVGEQEEEARRVLRKLSKL